jgi:hypothetical protein
VPQELLDELRVYPFGEEHCGAGVPQVVETDVRQSPGPGSRTSLSTTNRTSAPPGAVMPTARTRWSLTDGPFTPRIARACGVSTFVVLVVLRMPCAGALALLVAVLDLIPLVGATLGGALLVIVGLFVAPSKAVVLLVYIVIYQQVMGSIIQPMVYSRAVQLSGLVIFIAVLVGGMLLGIPGALLAIPVVEIIRIVVTELIAYRRATQEANRPAVSSSPRPPT